MALTQLTIVKAAPKERPYKLSDGNGLHLLVRPNGSKLWRYRYRFAGKENMIGLGAFPSTGLAEARTKRDDAKKLLEAGTDPATQKRLDKIAAATASQNTFGALVEEYLANMRESGASDQTIKKNRWLLEKLAAPLARRPIAEITAAEILDLLKRIEKSGRRETARRLRGTIGSIFRYAIVTLRATDDPTAPLQRALLAPNVQGRAAIIDERQLGALMIAIDEYDGWPTIRAGLMLLALTMTRPGDVRHMRRAEIDFEKAMWRIPAERMKMRRPHDVPLSRQALELLTDIWSLSDEGSFVLPAIRSTARPLSENAFNSGLRRMGYASHEMTAHGFRATASTILNERGFDPEVIETALAHQDKNDVRRAYNRAKYWNDRVNLMQAWADLLDEFRERAKRGTRAT